MTREHIRVHTARVDPLDCMRIDMDLYTADPADLVFEPYDNDLNERLLAAERTADAR